MNGFELPPQQRVAFSRVRSVSARSLLALALASWMGLNSLSAQEAEAPVAPPALTDEAAIVDQFTVEDTPPARPVVVRPARPVTSKTTKSKVSARLTPKAPAVRRPSVATSVWAEPELPSEGEVTPPIRQVQALVPSEGLGEVPPEDLSLDGTVVEPAPYEPGQTANEVAEPFIDEPPTEPAVEAVAPDESVERRDEPESEPAPLNGRVGNPQRLPAQFNIDRAAAAQAAPYNDREISESVAEFGPDDEVHTVVAGESYWTIAKKHYRLGRYSAALAEYNKTRIAKPDKIKPGMKVVIPPMATLDEKYGRLIFGSAYQTAQAEPTAPVKSGFFVDAQGQPMYRVGEGDTLSTIAQDHLGRSSRWPQIVGLNRDTLPNPDEMKLGTVLRLPTDASEAVKAR